MNSYLEATDICDKCVNGKPLNLFMNQVYSEYGIESNETQNKEGVAILSHFCNGEFNTLEDKFKLH